MKDREKADEMTEILSVRTTEHQPKLSQDIEVHSNSNTSSPHFWVEKIAPPHLIDTLPYVDSLCTEYEGEIALLLKEEMANIQAERGGNVDYLENMPLPVSRHLDDPTSLIGKELSRMAKKEPMAKLDHSKYTSFSVPQGTREKDFGEWIKAVDLSKCLLEHTSPTICNLELFNVHAQKSWTKHLRNLTQTEEIYKSDVKKQRVQLDNLSRHRKLEQVECSSELKLIERNVCDYQNNTSRILEAFNPLTSEVRELIETAKNRGIYPPDYSEDLIDVEGWKEACGFPIETEAPLPTLVPQPEFTRELECRRLYSADEDISYDEA